MNRKLIVRQWPSLVLAGYAVVAVWIPALAGSDPGNGRNDSGFDFSGSLRSRYESKQDFNFNGGDQDYVLTQLRLNFDYRPNRRTKFFLQLQDARIFGESRAAAPPINDDATPNIFADELDIHQAYLEHDFGAGKIRIGRQKFNIGDLRLVASLEWVNTARVHDGVRVIFGDSRTRQIDVFASALVPVDPNSLNNQGDVGNRYFDSDFHGIFVTDKMPAAGQLEYWYLYRGNSNVDDSVNTVGARYVWQQDVWTFDLQAAYQFGEFGGLNHSAHMAHVGLERPLADGKFGAAYNLGSGDDDPADTRHGTFDNLFPLNHAYYGFMDFFSLQNVHNFELTYQRKVFGKSGLRMAWQGFWLNEEDTDAWYNAGMRPLRIAAGDVDRYVGSEVDVTTTIPLIPDQLKLVIGYSHFFTGSYLHDTGPGRDANFFFVQARYTP